MGDERDPVYEIMPRRGATVLGEGQMYVPGIKLVYDNKAAQDSIEAVARDPNANLQYASVAAEAAMGEALIGK
eukprot:gene20456-29487_t